MSDEQRRTLLEKLSRGIAYAVPAVAIVIGGSAFHAIASDAVSKDGYQMSAVGEAEAAREAEAEAGHAEAEAEAKPAAEAHAEAHPGAEAAPEAEAEAEAHAEAEAAAGQ